MAEATAIDDRLASGDPVGPLAGIPIGVKDLEAAAGFTTALRLGPARRRPGGRRRLAARGPAAGGRLRRAGQDHDAGVRLPGRHHQPGVRADPQPVEHRPVAGRLVGRIGRGHRLGHGAAGHRAATAAGRSASRPRCAGCRASRPRRAGCPNGGATPPGSGLFTVKGPMARRIADVLYALDVCVGPDPTDVFSLPPPHAPWAGSLDDVSAPARVIWAPAPGFEVDAEIAAVCDAAVRQLAAAGTEVIEVERDLHRGAAGRLVHACGPSTASVARATCGARPTGSASTRASGPRWTTPTTTSTRSPSPRPSTRPTPTTSTWCALFDRAPLLLCPATAGQTAEVGRQGIVNGQESQFALAFTGAFNLTRNPAGTVCAGFTADGMPVGLQVVGPQHADVAVMRAIAALEEILGIDAVAPIA